MKVLTTGCCGFIGSNFINYMCTKYPEYHFYNIDKIDYCSNTKNVKGHSNYTFVYGNVCDYDLIKYTLNQYSINVVVHFAAQSHVDNSFGNSISFTNDNVLGTHTLLEACREYNKLHRFVHISTDEVYGEVDLEHSGCTEKSLLNPTNPYAATKAGAEFLVRSYYHSYKLPTIIIRGNNVYGPNQYPEKLIPKFIMHLLNNEKCTIHGKGESRRNFIYVDDVCSAVDTVLNKGIINEIYNIGTNNEHTVMDIFYKLCKELKPNENPEDFLEFVEDRCFNDFRYCIDSSKLKELGWTEQISFENGFKTTVNHYKENVNEYKKRIESSYKTTLAKTLSISRNLQAL
jgi:dTDP-glucose 4,6-dehydratase